MRCVREGRAVSNSFGEGQAGAYVEPSIGQGLFDLYPAFGERPQDFLGDTCHFAQPAAPHLPGEAETGELGA